MLETSVIIVNFRSEDYTLRLLERLTADALERPAQMIIIDNDPHPGRALKEYAAQNDGMEYYASGRNIGFAAAVNQGLSRTAHEKVILLNPDTHPEEGCLTGLLHELDRQASVAVAAPRLRPFDDAMHPTPSALRRDPGFLTAVVEYTAAHRLFGRQWLDRHYFIDPDPANASRECAMVQGACLALKKNWFDRVGGFDADRFFLYWEETDYCRRIRAKGGKVWYCPRLVCRHVGGGSTEDGEQNIAHFWHGFYAYHGKHAGALITALLRVALIVGIAAEYLLLWMLERLAPERRPVLVRDRRRLGRRWAAQWRI